MAISFSKFLAASALATIAFEPSYASPLECEKSPVYVGAGLRSPLDISSIPSGRSVSQSPMPRHVSEKLDAQFDRLVKMTDAPAVSITIWKHGLGYWERSNGISDDETASFWWASTGKLMTATVILQLINEGKLSRDTPVGSFFPDFAQASTVTIGDLLRHKSGIFTFNYDQKLRERKGYKSPQDLIDVAKSHPLDFCPGTNWHYSNTGYVMLALVAEQVEGSPFHEIVQKRISEPLEIPSLRVLKPDDDASVIIAPAGKGADQIADIASVFGAGGIISPSSEMVIFLNAYLEHDLIEPSAKETALATLYPMFGGATFYGDGVMVTDVPDKDRPTTWIGHSGGSENAKALLIYDVERDAYLAVALNKQVPAEALANTLLKTLD